MDQKVCFLACLLDTSLGSGGGRNSALSFQRLKQRKCLCDRGKGRKSFAVTSGCITWIVFLSEKRGTKEKA